MKYIRTNLKSIIIVVLLLAGLAVTLYLVKNPQIFKSRAGADAIKITTPDGLKLEKREDGKYYTNSDQIQIEVQDFDRL